MKKIKDYELSIIEFADLFSEVISDYVKNIDLEWVSYEAAQEMIKDNKYIIDCLIDMNYFKEFKKK